MLASIPMGATRNRRRSGGRALPRLSGSGVHHGQTLIVDGGQVLPEGPLQG